MSKQLNHVIYHLKTRYGRPIEVIHSTGSETNVETGETQELTERTKVRKAVVIPEEVYRKFGPAMPTQQNAYYDQSVRYIIIDRKTFKGIIQMGDNVVVDGQVYPIAFMVKDNETYAYYLKIEGVQS